MKNSFWWHCSCLVHKTVCLSGIRIQHTRSSFVFCHWFKLPSPFHHQQNVLIYLASVPSTPCSLLPSRLGFFFQRNLILLRDWQWSFGAKTSVETVKASWPDENDKRSCILTRVIWIMILNGKNVFTNDLLSSYCWDELEWLWWKPVQ